MQNVGEPRIMTVLNQKTGKRERIMVQLAVDEQEIMKQLAFRAFNSKSKQATALYKALVVDIIASYGPVEES